MSGAEPRHAHRADLEDSTDHRSDAELGALVRWSGDEGALGELYRRHQPAVLSYARTFARDPHTAEDLASEAFTRTLRTVRSGAGPDAAWRPYLLTVVRNTAAQWAATTRRTELSGDFEQWLEEQATVNLTPGSLEHASTEERIIAMENFGLIAHAFHSLPERWQAALWHSIVEGETTERIGILLGVSPSGVTSLTARAREGLREAYLGAYAESGNRSEECRRYGTMLAATVRRPESRVTRQLRRHLDGCEYCRRALIELTDLDQRLGAVLPAGLLLWGTHAYLATQLGTSTAATGVASPAAGSSGGAAMSTASTAGGKLALLGAAAAALSSLVVGGLLLTDDEEQSGKAPTATPSPSSATPPAAVPATPSTLPAPTSPSASPTASPSPSRTAAPSPSEWLPRAEDRTRLRLAATGRCMEIPGGSKAAALQAREAPCDGSLHQVWDLLRPGNDGRVQIRNAATGRCLANQGTETDGAPVVQTGCDSADPRQLWSLYAPEGSREARFIQRGDQMYLGLNDWANAADGKAHTTDIGTSHHYYGSSSFGFRYDGTPFDEAPFGGAPSRNSNG